jgi:chromosome segregation ATPase
MSAAPSAAAQLGELLRFFDGKRDLYLSEINHAFKDMREARLFEDVYSKDDIEEILAELQQQIYSGVKRDLDSAISMSALVLEQILTAAADDHGIPLSIDLAKTEDSSALARVRELASSGAAIGTVADSDLKRKNVVKLESLRDEHNRLIAENLRLTEESAALKERYEAMQMQCTMLTRDKAQLNAKVEATTAELAAIKSGADAATAQSSAHSAEVESLKAELAKLHAQAESAKTKLLAAEKERDASVNTSKPFMMLKNVLTKKNAQLAELRAKLKK